MSDREMFCCLNSEHHHGTPEEEIECSARFQLNQMRGEVAKLRAVVEAAANTLGWEAGKFFHRESCTVEEWELKLALDALDTCDSRPPRPVRKEVPK